MTFNYVLQYLLKNAKETTGIIYSSIQSYPLFFMRRWISRTARDLPKVFIGLGNELSLFIIWHQKDGQQMQKQTSGTISKVSAQLRKQSRKCKGNL